MIFNEVISVYIKFILRDATRGNRASGSSTWSAKRSLQYLN